MAKAINLTGQKFGHLTVIERDFEAQGQHKPERQAWWKCYCDVCGQTKSLRASVIKKSQTCGCKQNSDKKERKLIQPKPKTKENFRGIDLTGQRFNRLLVLEYADEEHQVFYGNKHKNTWKCLCDCGNIHYATTENLRRGDTPSCGCITKENGKSKLQDLTGQKFGHLTVLKWLGTINHNSKYLVKCDCGKEYEIYASNLIQGTTMSCGCIKESHGEQKIRNILISNNIEFVNQKIFKDFKFKDTNGIPRFDFYLPKKNIIIGYTLLPLLMLLMILGVYLINFKSGFLYEVHSILHGNLDDSFGTTRMFLWKRTIKMVDSRNILFGYGTDTFSIPFMNIWK